MTKRATSTVKKAVAKDTQPIPGEEVAESVATASFTPPDQYMHFPKDKPLRLDIGCGATGWQREPLDQWIHLDLVKQAHVEIVTDFGDIPLEDGVVDEIFIGDVIEHVPTWRYDKVLTEWNRVLKVGGAVNGRCPNIDRAMRDYANGKLSFNDAFLSIYGWATEPNQQHYQGFTKETLTKLLRKYGFEVTDYSGSPGPISCPWWLVFSGKKVSDVSK